LLYKPTSFVPQSLVARTPGDFVATACALLAQIAAARAAAQRPGAAPAATYGAARARLARAAAPGAPGVFDVAGWTREWERALVLAVRESAARGWAGGAATKHLVAARDAGGDRRARRWRRA